MKKYSYLGVLGPLRQTQGYQFLGQYDLITEQTYVSDMGANANVFASKYFFGSICILI